MNKDFSKTPIRLVVLSTFFVFSARGYQHIFWDAPFRTLFWDQGLLSGLVAQFGMTWETYVSSERVDKIIQNLIFGTGIVYLIAALASLYVPYKAKTYIKWIVYIGGFGLIFLAFLYYKEKFYQVGQFFEYSIQFSLPFVLIYCFSKNFSWGRLLLILKIVIALTFICHGMYAVGFYATPGVFIDMLISSIGVNEDTAISILFIAGIMDMLLLPLMFFKPTERFALLYAFTWGILTALARLTGNFSGDFIMESIHQYVFEVVLRLAHGLVPLAAYFIVVLRKNKPEFFKIKS